MILVHELRTMQKKIAHWTISFLDLFQWFVLIKDTLLTSLFFLNNYFSLFIYVLWRWLCCIPTFPFLFFWKIVILFLLLFSFIFYYFHNISHFIVYYCNGILKGTFFPRLLKTNYSKRLRVKMNLLFCLYYIIKNMNVICIYFFLHFTSCRIELDSK